jgi:selenophosphate synthetase-related protein
LTANNVAAGQSLLLAACLEGQLRDDFGFYPSYEQRGTAVRDDIDLMRLLAEGGAAVAAKDVSMAGMLGTLAMLLQPSGCGATVDLGLVPRPEDVAMDRWLEVFPSYAFLLCAPAGRVDECVAAFTDRGLACAQIGIIDATAALRLRMDSREITLLDDVAASATGLAAASSDQHG